jgi:hypothetical protein
VPALVTDHPTPMPVACDTRCSFPHHLHRPLGTHHTVLPPPPPPCCCRCQIVVPWEARFSGEAKDILRDGPMGKEAALARSSKHGSPPPFRLQIRGGRGAAGR